MAFPFRWRTALPLALVPLAACTPPERAFDELAAFDHLTAQTELGPRVPGTEAHAAALASFQAHLGATADQVTLHTFESSCPLDGSPATYHNVVASFRPDADRRILFGAHWDSRPVADRDPDPARRGEPVLGANDGASGVAILLEVASALKRVPPTVGVDLLLFDGEDCGVEGDPQSFALGSQRFVRDHPDYRPGYAVILDMVGRDGARFLREGNSVAAAPFLVEAVWSVAREESLTAFVDSLTDAVFDDHIPFLQARIPAVDIIDREDPHWHTVDDTPEHCSPATLGQVGRLVLALIRRSEEAKRS